MTPETLVALRPADSSAAACRQSLARLAAEQLAAAQELSALAEARHTVLLTETAAGMIKHDHRAAQLGAWSEQLVALQDAVTRSLADAIRRERVAALAAIGARANAAVAAVNARMAAEYPVLIRSLMEFADIPDEAVQLAEQYRREVAGNADIAGDVPKPEAVTSFIVHGMAPRGPMRRYVSFRDCLAIPEMPGVADGHMGRNVDIWRIPGAY